jgi:hypothetical protein
MIKPLFFFLFLFLGVSCLYAQNPTYSNSYTLTNDTTLSIFSNSKVDYSNFSIWAYTMEPKYYSVKQPLQKFSIENIDTLSVDSLQFYFNDYFYTNQDSLIKNIFSGTTTPLEKAFKSFYFLKDRSVYFFYPEDKLNDNHYSYQESHGLMKMLNNYGHFACGGNGYNLARMNALYSKQRQYNWELSNGDHSISEIVYDSVKLFLDADREAYYKQLNNLNFASFKDVLFDPYLNYRTKIFSNSTNYSPANSATAINIINNTGGVAWPVDSNKVFTNIIGQQDSCNVKKIAITLFPNSKITFFPDSSNVNAHFTNSAIGINFKNNNLKMVAMLGNIVQKYDSTYTLNQLLVHHNNMVKSNDTLLSLLQNANSNFITKTVSSYPLTNGIVSSILYKKTIDDSIAIYFSKDYMILLNP